MSKAIVWSHGISIREDEEEITVWNTGDDDQGGGVLLRKTQLPEFVSLIESYIDDPEK